MARNTVPKPIGKLREFAQRGRAIYFLDAVNVVWRCIPADNPNTLFYCNVNPWDFLLTRMTSYISEEFTLTPLLVEHLSHLEAEAKILINKRWGK